VALSLKSPSPAINRHRSSVVPGLSSATNLRQQPSSHLNDGKITQSAAEKQQKIRFSQNYFSTSLKLARKPDDF